MLRSIRLFSTKRSAAELLDARQWVDKLTVDGVPRDQFAVSYSRSSGPGGQNVNKVSSKATIKLSKEQWVQSAQWIPDAVREQIFTKNFPYTTKSGSLVIQSDRTRNRQENLQDCFDKLVREIKQHVDIGRETDEKTLQKWSNVRKRANEGRLEQKKMASVKKQSRKGNSRRDEDT